MRNNSHRTILDYDWEHPKCVKTYFVIASVMKWTEAITKSRCCDCFLLNGDAALTLRYASYALRARCANAMTIYILVNLQNWDAPL
ncbi:hypothetical protein BC008_24665 [Mastigocoleus testarum BC008]|uniref:Uncharacterized protein n=1 Tax=Mastigocoleus testarum BC008 TaxID=371196 RepID=A0A0V7ZP03_9CYAN|nr:hypothetical protein BC008_24665 [Mastigocoleus testarum BC008]